MPNPNAGFLSLVLALLTGACSTSGMTSYTPVKEKTKYSSEALFEASVRILEASGHPIKDRDTDKFWLVTREKEVAISSVPRLSYKYSWRVDTANGTLSIGSTCAENSSMNRTKFNDCGEDRPEKVVNEQKTIRDRILTEAKKLP